MDKGKEQLPHDRIKNFEFFFLTTINKQVMGNDNSHIKKIIKNHSSWEQPHLY